MPNFFEKLGIFVLRLVSKLLFGDQLVFLMKKSI